MEIPEMILEQLGGNKFIAMTGVKNLIYDNNSLRMDLPRNLSKSNKLIITLEENDTYVMRFVKFTDSRVNKKTFEFIESKEEENHIEINLYCDQLQSVFTVVTGMDTTL